MTGKQIWSIWHDFWFRPVTPEPVALFRIFYGILVLQLLLIHLGGDFLTWYGSHAIVSAEAVREHFWLGEPRFDILLFFKTDEQLMAYYFSIVFFAVLLTIGLFTRVSAIYVTLALISLHHHNPYNINGGDAFVRLVGIWLMFSNAGDCYSVDRWLLKRRNPDLPVAEKAPWAQRMIQMQLAIVYCQTFWIKFSGAMWLDGTAVYYATRLQDLQRFPFFLFNSIIFCKLLTWYTLVVEFLMWTFVWVKKFRYYILASALLLHLGIDFAINLPVFEWAFIVTLVTFVEPEDIRKFFAFVQCRLSSMASFKKEGRQSDAGVALDPGGQEQPG